jgi:hypothetical protein
LNRATGAWDNGAKTARLAKRAALVLTVLLLGGCDTFPRDPSHSLEDIRARGTIRVGVQPNPPAQAAALLQRLERATGARAEVRAGNLEPMLQKLEDGDIDLVIAPFKKDTPWAMQSALSPPIRSEGQGDAVIEWRAAMRSGENRWIILVETNARKVAHTDTAR